MCCHRTQTFCGFIDSEWEAKICGLLSALRVMFLVYVLHNCQSDYEISPGCKSSKKQANKVFGINHRQPRRHGVSQQLFLIIFQADRVYQFKTESAVQQSPLKSLRP